MKGSRELNNIKDTPSFKVKKVLALSKLRHSSSTGRKGAAPSASKVAKKTVAVKGKVATSVKPTTSDKLSTDITSVKTGNEKKEKSFSHLNVVRKPGRPAKKHKKSQALIKTQLVEQPELNKNVAQEEPTEEVSTEPNAESSSTMAGKKKIEKSKLKSRFGSQPERKLRSQIDEMLMRHGKKVTKAPKQKRKRTLSSDFELLDEKALKRNLKESVGASSGTDTDQNDSDVSAVTEMSGEKIITKTKKKKQSKVVSKASPSLDSSWVDCPSPLIDTDRKTNKRLKTYASSRDSSVEGSEDSVIVRRKGKKQTTIRRKVNLKVNNSDDVPPIASCDSNETMNQKEESDDKTRSKGSKRKRGNSVEKNNYQKSIEIKQSIDDDSCKDSETKKPKIVKSESQIDPYMFVGQDFEDEVDTEVTFKPSGISGEMKRKPGRPKHGVSRQPAVKALKVKSTHKLLISDQKPKPFSRVRGGRILKASQLYRGLGQRKRQMQLVSKQTGNKKGKSSIQGTVGLENASGVEKKLPPVKPSKLDIVHPIIDTNFTQSPDIQHPELTQIRALISPASSNDDLEPPILELANINPDEDVLQSQCDNLSDKTPDGYKTSVDEISQSDDISETETFKHFVQTSVKEDKKTVETIEKEENVDIDTETDFKESKLSVDPEASTLCKENASNEQSVNVEPHDNESVKAEPNANISESNSLGQSEAHTRGASPSVDQIGDQTSCDNIDIDETSQSSVARDDTIDETGNAIDQIGEQVCKERDNTSGTEDTTKSTDVKMVESEDMVTLPKENTIETEVIAKITEQGENAEDTQREAEGEVMEPEDIDSKPKENTIETENIARITELDKQLENTEETGMKLNETEREEKITEDMNIEKEDIDKEKRIDNLCNNQRVHELSEDNVDKCEPDMAELTSNSTLDISNQQTDIDCVVEEAVEGCIQSLLDSVDEMVPFCLDSDKDQAVSEKENKVISDNKEDDSQIQMKEKVSLDDNSDADSKDKEAKFESVGIKMKLKRHKGKFKVTRLSEDDDSVVPDEVNSDLVKDKDIRLVMNSILDEIDSVFETNQSPKSQHAIHSSDNDISFETTDMDHMTSCSSAEVSPTDSEKKVPPLTIRLNSSKTGKKPVRKFELRPKFSRSPIEIIAMRQKRYEEEYDKNEATRLAKKLEKQTGKRKGLIKAAPKDENVVETGLEHSEETGNINDMLEYCTPCVVSVVDFVKQLNLQPEEEHDINDIGSEPVGPEDEHLTIENTVTPEIPKKGTKPAKKSQFKSGRPRGRPPKLKNKLKPVEVPEQQPAEVTKPVEQVSYDNFESEVGFVGSFVEFLKAGRNEPTRTLKGTKYCAVSKSEKKIDCKSDQKQTSPTVVDSPTNVAGTITATKTTMARTKHLSGEKTSGVKYVCNKCEFSSGFEKTMVFHIYRHIPGVSFKCGYCNKDFQSMVAASTHSKNEHPGKDSRIIKSKDLNEREHYHVVEEQPKVDPSLVKSIESGHVSPGAAPGQVIISFLVDSNLSLKTYKRFVCTHCEYSTDVLEDIQQHCKDLHTTENMFACILCSDAYFSSEQTVKNHSLATHPTRPQSYRKLPSFYDIEQMKAAEKSQLEDRGNIFDRMNNLFSTPGSSDESNSENQRKAHYQRARDFLFVQEGWKNKTSAEADSTTILDSETVHCENDNRAQEQNDVQTTVSDNQPEQNKTLESTDSVSKEQTKESMQSEQSDKSDVSHIKEFNTTEGKAANLSKTETEGASEKETTGSEANTKAGNLTTESHGETRIPPPTKVTPSKEKEDDSGICGLKIVDVVSLRDQNQEEKVTTPLKKTPQRPSNHSARTSSNLPEVDVDALVLRNERITCTYKCMKCNIHSPYLSAMVEHLKHYHSEITLFTCPYCRGINAQKPEFKTEVNVHEHVKKEHPSNCAKNEVSLSDTAKTFVQVLAIPSGVECNKVGNTFVIEKDIYMCLKCQAHMPSLDYTFGHLEREHPDAFVQVCPICKTFKDKSDEVVYCHIMKEHKKDPNDHPLSVAIEDNLFVRIPSISKSGAYNDKANPSSKTTKGDSPRKILPKPSTVLQKNDDSEDDVLLVGESRNPIRPSAIQSNRTYTKRGRPPSISQDSFMTQKSIQKSPVKHQQSPNITHPLRQKPVTDITACKKVVTEHSQELMMDCENIDDPVNTLTDVVEDHGDVVPTVVASSSIGPIIDTSTLISHSAAMAVASSVMSMASKVPTTTKSVASLSIQPRPTDTVGQQPKPTQAKIPMTNTTNQASTPSSTVSQISSQSAKSLVVEKLKEMQMSRPKSMFSMTDKLNRLHMRAAERERQKEKVKESQSTNNQVDVRNTSPIAMITQDSSRNMYPPSRSSHLSPPVSQAGASTNRPVLKVPTYHSRPAKPPMSKPMPTAGPTSQSIQKISPSSIAQRKSLLFRNCPLDLSRTPSPAKPPSSVSKLLSSSPAGQSKPVSDELPPDAFKIFNLKPDSRRPKSASASPSPAMTPPAQQMMGTAIPNLVGTLAPPGTLLQQVQALPYTQLAQMQMAGALNPLQLQALQGLCIPGTNNSFVLANIPQLARPSSATMQQQMAQFQVRPNSASSTASSASASQTARSTSQATRPSSAKTVAQALAERAARPHLPQQQGPRASNSNMNNMFSKFNVRMNKANTPPDFYCPYCVQVPPRPLREYEVRPHIERCHPGYEIRFFRR